MEERAAALETQKDEWSSVLKLRLIGCATLEARGADGTKEFWKFKTELCSLAFPHLEPVLIEFFGAVTAKLKCERQEILGNPNLLVEVFPTGGQWGEHKGIDEGSRRSRFCVGRGFSPTS